MLLSGKNKMVTSGYETKFWGETAYVCYLIHLLNSFFLLNLTNIPDASLNPVKVYQRAVVLFLQIP